MSDQLKEKEKKALEAGATQEDVLRATRKWEPTEEDYEIANIQAAGNGLTESEASIDFSMYEGSANPFEGYQTVKPVATNSKSTKVLAATSALLAGSSIDEALEQYKETIANELQEGAAGLKGAVDSTRMRAMENNKGMAKDILLSPELDDNQKLTAIKNMSSPDSPMYDPHLMLAQKGLENPSDTDTESSYDSRINLADILGTINEQRAQLNVLNNSNISKLDPDTMNALWDFSTAAVLPFIEPAIVGNVYDEFKKVVDTKDKEGLFSWLAGNQKTVMRDAFIKASPEDKLMIAEKLSAVIMAHAGTPVTGANDPAKMMLLEELMGDAAYDADDKFIDNAIELLDWTVVGGVALGTVKKLADLWRGTGATMETIMRDSVRSSIRSDVSPQSPAAIMQDTNPSAAREMHKIMAEDESGEAAEALYGTTTLEALVNDIIAQADTVDDTVKYRVGDMDIEAIGSAVEQLSTGALEYTAAEKALMRAKYLDAYENVKGLSNRREMAQVGDVEDLSDGVRIKNVYGPAEGAFTNAQDAIDMVLFGMRDLGVTANDVTLLQRVGNKFVPTDIGKVEATKLLKEQGVVDRALDMHKDEFLVQVKSEYKFKDPDVGAFSDFDVKNNMFERIGAAAGGVGDKLAGVFSTIQNYALDPASMIDPQYFSAASRAVTRSAGIEKEILKYGGEFGTLFTNLPKKRQQVLEAVIKEANHTGTVYSKTKAAADGLEIDEAKALYLWGRTWDTMYILENADAVRTLRNGGYKEVVDETSDVRLFAKPVTRGRIDNPTVYDSATGEARLLTNTELDKLYEEGGTLASLRNPQEVNGNVYEYTIVQNKAGGSYLRELNDNSEVLKRRTGYYAVKYKDPYFIDRIIKRADGSTYRQAVATAGNAKDAALLQRRLKEQYPDIVDDAGNVTSQVGDPRLDSKSSGDDAWDLAYNTGRSAQRARGERLSGVSGNGGGIDPSMANIHGPVESMLSSARSIANRVSMRKVIDTGKSRFVETFKDFMPVDPKTHLPRWPNTISDLRAPKSNPSDKKLADARTMWNYINYLENGYANGLDQSYKAILNGLAKISGNKSKNLENALRYMADTRGPSAFGKNVAFHAYLVGAPIRQLLVQSHQAIQLTANFPKQVARSIPTQMPLLLSGMLGADLTKANKAVLKAAGLTGEEAAKMFKAFQNSGLVAQIDKQNLVRNAVTHLVDQEVQSARMGKLMKYPTKALDFSRKVGFDAGEFTNQATSFLAHYNQAKSKGLNMDDATVLDELIAKSTNYTYNMNAAGDMKYNQDSLSLLMQFLQVPHKAFTQMTFNRLLSPVEKARLMGFNLALYGLPATVAVEWASNMFPDSPEMQHIAAFGAESMMLNKLLNDEVGTESDFSFLSATGAYGLYEHVAGLFTTDVGEMFANTPAGKLFFGSNPRITNAFKSAARAIGFYDYEETPTTTTMAVKDALRIFSGFNSAFKGMYADEVGHTMSKKDLTVTEEDNFRQMLFGVRTADESRSQFILEKYFKNMKSVKEDVSKWYSQYKAQMTNANLSPQDMEWVARTHNEAFRVWSKDPQVHAEVIKHIDSLMRRDVQRGDVSLVSAIVKLAGFITNDEAMSLLRNIPESDAYDKEAILKSYEMFLFKEEE